MPNAYQQANLLLDSVLGPEARAIWLCARVDDKPLHVIAKEFKLPVRRVREIVEQCDSKLVSASIPFPVPVARPPAKTNWGGFHQIGDE